MIVYRIAKHDGLGPYSLHGIAGGFGHGGYGDRVHPTPNVDGMHGFTTKHYSAFISLEQLTNWFNMAERDTLEEHNYKVYKVDVDEVHFGRRQCAILGWMEKFNNKEYEIVPWKEVDNFVVA